MSGEEPREIVSRRGRPAKAALSRDLIVSTALEILERDGLNVLSLRRVAAALDTGASSLYVYLASLGELHALMLDQALAAVRSPEDRDIPWRDRLKAILLSYGHVLHGRRGLAQLAMSTTATGPNALRLWELLLGLLKEGEADDVKAAWGVDLLLLYVTAVAAEQGNWRESGHGIGQVKEAFLAVSAEQFPLLFAAKEALLSDDGDARFGWAIDLIVDGIVIGRLATSEGPKSRGKTGRSRRRG